MSKTRINKGIGDGSEQPKPVSNAGGNHVATQVLALMQEYFQLKDANKKLRQDRCTFMETYKCLTPYSDDSYEQPTDCISWLNTPRMRSLSFTMCQPCSHRHSFYMALRKNAHERMSITHRVRQLTKVTDMQPSDSQSQDKVNNKASSNQQGAVD